MTTSSGGGGVVPATGIDPALTGGLGVTMPGFGQAPVSMGLPTLLDPFASQQQAGQGANGEQLGAEDFWKQATGLTDPAA